jgi:putative sterol carrier protein
MAPNDVETQIITGGRIMAYRFGSEEWIMAYQQVINDSPAYERAAATWEGDFFFIIQPDANYAIEAIYYLDLWHGKCRRAALVSNGENLAPVFRIEAASSHWKAIIDRKLDPIQGMMTRRLKLTGDFAKIMRAVPAAHELVNCATQVPTEFQ